MTSQIAEQHGHHTVKDHDWHYILLELTPDPNSSQLKTITDTIDKITWKSKILAGLSRSYGLLGESLHFDILMSELTTAVIRIDKLDTERFINALFGYVFKIQLSYNESNGEADVKSEEFDCYLRVVNHGDYLGLVVKNNFKSA
ncbi:hypothetical protein DFJ63DRAFT_317333 [Scheffersomyces coipomensis]|uniref:uncharacterized protein n=1 Tax=Scheffersomyces coipomensis TaxID=1788519 RepID=UPI00315CE67E